MFVIVTPGRLNVRPPAEVDANDVLTNVGPCVVPAQPDGDVSPLAYIVINDWFVLYVVYVSAVRWEVMRSSFGLNTRFE